MVKDGIFYALGLGVVAAILGYLTGSITLVALPLVLALFFLQFFRNPRRGIRREPGRVVPPADGVVTDVEWVETKNGSRLRLSVFLSVFDVHVNRAPVSGTVTAVEYHKGQFKNAMSREASLLNEQKTGAI